MKKDMLGTFFQANQNSQHCTCKTLLLCIAFHWGNRKGYLAMVYSLIHNETIQIKLNSKYFMTGIYHIEIILS